MSEYIVRIQQWCEEMLNFCDASIAELREQKNVEALQDWKIQFSQFKEALSHEMSLDDSEIFERAHEFDKQLDAHLENINRVHDEKERFEWKQQAVPIGGHTLPALPYAYNALEPYIDEETMRLHHDKHHKSYVDGLNKAEKEMEKARSTNNFDLIKHWENEAAFHGAGHYLHTIFWDIMHPNGGGQPTGNLLKELERSFGSFEQFKKHFTEAANAVEGGGWAILVWSPRSRRLEILQAEKHQNLSQWDVVPLLVLDVWEHAYYLKYKNERKKYIENWWNVVHWPKVEERYKKASQLKWDPF